MTLPVLLAPSLANALQSGMDDLTKGLYYANAPLDLKFLIPFGDFTPGVHSTGEPPYSVSQNLISAWLFLEKQLYKTRQMQEAGIFSDPLSLEVLLALNCKLVPEECQPEVKFTEILGLAISSMSTFSPMTVSINELTPDRINSLEHMRKNIDQTITEDLFLLLAEINSSSPAIWLTIPASEMRKLVVAKPQQDEIRNTITSQDNDLFHNVPDEYRCPLLTAAAELETLCSSGDLNSHVISYFAEFCDRCPVNEHRHGDETEEQRLMLDYQSFSHREAVERILPELHQRFRRQLMMANSQQEVVDIIADFTQLFLLLHPFPDGNGRTFRFYANYILMLYGMPPLAFHTFKAIPLTRSQWRKMFRAAHEHGQQLMPELNL